MNKLISFVVPCYNSQEYMEKCISLLANAGNEIEVLIIDDGSTDNTLKIAHDFEQKYPEIVKCIHEENKGHGGAIQTGLKLASGIYFKVVDSDDWVNTDDVVKFCNIIKANNLADNNPDLYILNYVYERVKQNSSIVVDYAKYLPENRIFSWNEMKKFPQNKVFMMHSLVYKTDVLKESKIVLPEHTFYEDNYLTYLPLPYCKKLYYINDDFYHYLLGRENQSCTDENLFKNYKFQTNILKKVFTSYSYTEINKFDKRLAQYLIHSCRGMYLLSIIFNAGGKNNIKERKADYKNLKRELKILDLKLYKKISLYIPVLLVRVRPWFLRRMMAYFSMAIRDKLSL